MGPLHERPPKASALGAAIARATGTDVAIAAGDRAVVQAILIRAFDPFVGTAITIGLLVLLTRLGLLAVVALLLGLARLALLVLLPGLLALGVVGLLLQALVVAVLVHGRLLPILLLAPPAGVATGQTTSIGAAFLCRKCDIPGAVRS